MKLGMFTACLPRLGLTEIADYATRAGYQALEVAVWPGTAGRGFQAAHLPVADFGPAAAEEVQRMLASRDLEISALGYYENNLHPDPGRRTEIRTHLKHAVDAAASLGVPSVGTFVGRDWTRSVAENLREAERILPELLVDYAGEHGVQLMIENCTMEGWHPDGYPGNLAYSPELWEWMFSLGLFLNWDPSHLVWIGIDPVETIAPYADRIVHAQAKDVELRPRDRQRWGHFGPAVDRSDPWAMGWWRYRIPGLGEVDWTRVVDRLYECGFTGTLSVEHEDPVWGGDEVRVEHGLDIAHRTLRPLFVP